MKKAELTNENEILRAALKRIMEYASDEHIEAIRVHGVEAPYAYAVG